MEESRANSFDLLNFVLEKKTKYLFNKKCWRFHDPDFNLPFDQPYHMYILLIFKSKYFLKEI